MDKIVVLDFGGQYAHLIANRVRRLGVFSEIKDGNVSVDELLEYKGIILSGGPSSVTSSEALKCDPSIFDLGIPIMGICYGHQLIADMLGGVVEPGNVSEYGHTDVEFIEKKGVFEDMEDEETTWMSHFDQVVKPPQGFKVVAKTQDCPIAGMADYSRNIYTMQFHPEVTHTPHGRLILEDFVNLTHAKREWNIDQYIVDVMEDIKARAKGKKVFLMISGGVDSTVAFVLLTKALSQNRVYGLFVDTGFMRLNEGKEVHDALKELGVENLHVYNAENEYFSALNGVYDPEEKRKIIGDLFLEIQKKVSDDLGLNPEEWILAQGTIYPDTIETGGTKHSDKIKTHHNRVEKIQKLIEEGKVIEPIAQLYKDEVRLVGSKLGLSSKMVDRHPFPGPGLAVRILCAKEKDYPNNVDNLEKDIDEQLGDSKLRARVLPIKSVGVQGDERTYRHPVSLYGEPSSWDELHTLATRLTNRFSEINRAIWCLTPNEITLLDTSSSWLTKDRVLTTQIADKVVMDFIKEHDLYSKIWQFPTVLIPVLVNGSDKESIVLRPVESQEAMTANFYRMDMSLLSELTKRLMATGKIGAVFYDITNKPPGTIEWE